MIQMPDPARQEFSRLARAAWDFPGGEALAELLDTLNLRRVARFGPQAAKVGVLTYPVPPPEPQPEDEDWL
jgi:hypothetical protein